MFFFFNDTATTEIYTLSLHDALPIFGGGLAAVVDVEERAVRIQRERRSMRRTADEYRSECRAIRVRRSEEHTSELQSQSNLVCRLLLEKKKKKKKKLKK